MQALGDASIGQTGANVLERSARIVDVLGEVVEIYTEEKWGPRIERARLEANIEANEERIGILRDLLNSHYYYDAQGNRGFLTIPREE